MLIKNSFISIAPPQFHPCVSLLMTSFLLVSNSKDIFPDLYSLIVLYFLMGNISFPLYHLLSYFMISLALFSVFTK